MYNCILSYFWGWNLSEYQNDMKAKDFVLYSSDTKLPDIDILSECNYNESMYKKQKVGFVWEVYAMKKWIGLLSMCMMVFGLVGCQSNPTAQNTSGAYDFYEGYLKVDGDQLLVNDFEFIDLADQYWIRELQLTDEDMPNGYYIYDTSDEWLTFTLTDETRYNFYDTGALFVSEDDQDRLYTTTNLDDFLKKFAIDDEGNLSITPFEVQVLEDGRVLSISEIFVN